MIGWCNIWSQLTSVVKRRYWEGKDKQLLINPDVNRRMDQVKINTYPEGCCQRFDLFLMHQTADGRRETPYCPEKLMRQLHPSARIVQVWKLLENDQLDSAWLVDEKRRHAWQSSLMLVDLSFRAIQTLRQSSRNWQHIRIYMFDAGGKTWHLHIFKDCVIAELLPLMKPACLFRIKHCLHDTDLKPKEACFRCAMGWAHAVLEHHWHDRAQETGAVASEDSVP